LLSPEVFEITARLSIAAMRWGSVIESLPKAMREVLDKASSIVTLNLVQGPFFLTELLFVGSDGC